ncbi:nitrilase family protein [Devosia sp. SL43]|uniref:nitrilase family protein n=1 Tax=Devosia sp. SL43 TaxID=2806348 RepID=UPI001F46F3B8|nr:nitrilase family protein [Devosia sp. SL43]UJW84867.1 nitrilase family protein [Devosia sp. SL43]
MQHLTSPDSTVVASIQFQPEFGAVAANLDVMERLIRQAAERGASVHVLPELADTGYVFERQEELEAVAGAVPQGESARRLIALSEELSVYIACGLAERDGDDFFNAAILAGPNGFIGKYRKLHLWNRETLFFQPGNLGLPVFDTPVGLIGLAICYDGWFPETFRALALGGAQLVCVPTNWVPMAGQAEGEESIANTLIRAAAHSNGIYIAAADRIGVERGQPFIGRSLIVGPDGLALAGPASAANQEIILARAQLGSVESSRKLNQFNNVLGDRRTDIYGTDPSLSENNE